MMAAKIIGLMLLSYKLQFVRQTASCNLLINLRRIHMLILKMKGLVILKTVFLLCLMNVQGQPLFKSLVVNLASDCNPIFVVKKDQSAIFVSSITINIFHNIITA